MQSRSCPVQLQVLPQPNQPTQPELNWSEFKPEFSSMSKDDVEAYFLRINDWVETHNFPELVKVQRFCLTLVGKVRLWYGSLRSIAVVCNGLQDQSRQ